MNEELLSKVEELREQYTELQESVAMADVAEKLTDTGAKIVELPAQVEQIRSDGYAFAGYLEGKVETLSKQWDEVHGNIVEALEEELQRAQNEMEELDDLWMSLDEAIASDEAELSDEVKQSALDAMKERAESSRTTGKFGAAVASASVPKLSAAGGGETEKKGSGLLGSLGAKAADEKSSGGGMLGALGAQAADEKSSGGGMLGALGASVASGDEEEDEKPASSLGALGGSMGQRVAVDVNNDEEVEKLVNQIEGAMERLSNTVENAKERIDTLYGPVPENVDQTIRQIKEINGYLELAKEASFDWLAGEDMFMVVKAEWVKTGKDKQDPDGYFYVSNQRVIMEQNEKVGGGMFRKGEEVHEILWEAPVSSLEEVKSEKKGMLGGIDLIHLSFGSGGPFGDTTIEVKGGIDAKWFAGKLKQVAKGTVEQERGHEPNKEEVEMLQDAPTTCPTCGATFDQPVTRGEMQLECAYCGSIVRLG